MSKTNKKDQQTIEKPWAIYGWCLGSWRIGKVVGEFKNICHIQYCEGQRSSPESWDSEWVKKFNNPLEAINYYLEHSMDKEYHPKEKVMEYFLSNFPSEKANLEKLLAQSSPKCTSPEAINKEIIIHMDSDLYTLPDNYGPDGRITDH